MLASFLMETAQEHGANCHTHQKDFAPINIMGTHLHSPGGIMISYRYMRMNMNGLQNGTDAIGNSEIFNMYMMAPQTMNMGMHMLGLMAAPTDWITLMVMGGFTSNSIEFLDQNADGF